MRKVGRRPLVLTERDMEMLNEYFNSDKSLQEMADKYNMTKSMVCYRIKKYKEQQAEEQQK